MLQNCDSCKFWTSGSNLEGLGKVSLIAVEIQIIIKKYLL